MTTWSRAHAMRLLCGCACALAASTACAEAPAMTMSAAPAAPATDDPTSATEQDAIVVRGQHEGVKDAQIDQIRSRSLVSIISGEELRAQPQQNLADLLTRLPGLNSSVDQSRNAAATGEAQYVSIRGLDTAYNAYMLDGVRMAQTDARTRAISMNLLSPFSVSQVRVDKAPTANLDGDAIAGIIDLRTATAFDLPEHHVQLRAQGQVAGRAAARGQDPWGGAAQVETAQRFGDFGVYASGYYGRKYILGESTAVQQDYEKYNNNITGMIRDNLDNLFARGAQWNVFRNKIDRFGGTINLDWRGETTQLYLRSTYGEYRLKSWMDQTVLRQASPLASGQINPNPNRGSYDAAGYRADYGLIPTHYHRTEHSNQSLASVKAGGRTAAGALTIDYHAAYSKGTQDYPLRIQSGFAAYPYIGAASQGSATFRVVDSLSQRTFPQVVLDDGARAAIADLSKIKQWYVTAQFENTWEERWEGGTDLEWHVADEGLVSIAAGAKGETSRRYANSLGDDGALQYTFPLAIGQAAPRWNAQGPALTDIPGEMLGGFMNNAAQVPIKLLDTRFIENQVRSLSLSKLPGVDPSKFEENELRGTEDRIAGYAMATLQFGDLTLIPGVRYEYNRFGGQYYQQVSRGGSDSLVRTNTSRHYDQVLPSLIATYRPNDTTVYRASIRKSYSRPAFDLLLGPTSVGYDDAGRINSVSVPNPDLKAQEAWNVDASVELKGTGTDFLSLAGYYKRLSHVLFATGTTNAGGDYNVWSQQPVSVDGVETTTLDTSAKGDVYGVEAAARYSVKGLPGLFDGLGVNGNITLQRAQAKVLVNGQMRDQRLPQVPRIMFNAELFYLHGPVAAALSYAYTGLKLYDLRSSRPDTYVQPFAKMNLVGSYTLRPGFVLGASVENLLNQHALWATTSSRAAYLSNDRKGGYVETGRIYMLNLTYAF